MHRIPKVCAYTEGKKKQGIKILFRLFASGIWHGRSKLCRRNRQAYFTSKCLDKQKKIQVKYPKIVIEPVISGGTPTFGILTTYRAHDPDLIILDQSDERFGIFGLSNDRWAQVQKSCQKPLLVVKRGASASRRP